MSDKSTSFEWIDTDKGLEPVVEALASADAYALDTEFHRERTYFPKLALLQLAWEPDNLVLVDPLKVDLHPLADVFQGPGTAVIHAASQDLEVLHLACGTIPQNVFDTQIAAGFIGYSTPSLAVLHERLLDEKLPKADRLTDWLRRPLGDDALTYAASDVLHLLEIRDLLVTRLIQKGRLDWAINECDEHRDNARVTRAPEDAWQRCKEARHLSGRSAAIAQAVGAWRERRAARLDIPVRHVLGDLALVGIAQRPPSTVAQLRSTRGVDARSLKDDVADGLLEAIEVGRHAEPPVVVKRREPSMDRDLRPAITLVSGWISQLANDLDLDTTLLATRHDIEALLAGTSDARLREGWRADLVGAPVHDLLEGRAALSFSRGKGIVLESRPGQDEASTTA